MNSTSIPPERQGNPTHFGGEGLYESTGTEEATSLKVRLGDHLDSMTQGSLQVARRSTGPMVDVLKQNPLAVALAVAGFVWLLTSQRRRSDWE